MRRLFLCFLLCLMPLRLLAGVWMPMAQGLAYPLEAPVSASLASHADAGHAGHEFMDMAVAGSAHKMHEAHALHELHEVPNTAVDAAASKADCHDGGCQLCGVCHQSANLMVWPWGLAVVQAQPVPETVPQPQAAMVLSPLIKPPIS
ncbi:MAG: hypothetical protein AAB176_14090 [Pseudomonadota bacterium]|jgi:hypothetical protein